MVPDPTQVLDVVEEAALASAGHQLAVVADPAGSRIVLQVVLVQLLLEGTQADAQDVLVFGLQEQ